MTATVPLERAEKRSQDRIRISKGAYLAGLQCDKLLWHRFHTPEAFPAVDPQTQAIFDQGQQVTELARELFPDGILIDGEGIAGVAQRTRDALKLRCPVFEPAFESNGCFSRADILFPVPESDRWDIIEVKSTTGVKDVHLYDLAFQRHVLTNSGLSIRKLILAHVNNEYVRDGKLDAHGIFTLADVTERVANLDFDVAGAVNSMFHTVRLTQHPPTQIGPRCDWPYACPLHDRCWKFLPEHSVFTLYRGGEKSFTLLGQRIQKLQEIPDQFKLTTNQLIQRQVLRTGKPHVNKEAIEAFLKRLRYPIHYLDFESFATALPIFDAVRPYQQIPFQFSLHIVQSEGSDPEHHTYLADGRNDPRHEFMGTLKPVLGTTGSIVVYNAGFEKCVLRDGCDFLPEFSGWLGELAPRFVDLFSPFRSFHYYHPAQDGDASIKAVLPAITGKNYEHLQIRDGASASLEFLRVHFGTVSDAERNRIRKHLHDYCHWDTAGMIWIVERLAALVRS
ncbi:MAG: DUF2779 domain-containing protein [Verrucomicrobiales bacterium]|nr:DUF2779 domain-containing protein [Verrucomicrobiales bacterium]